MGLLSRYRKKRSSPPIEAGYSRSAVKLNLGCGDKILDGYINVDVVDERAGKIPEVVADITQILPFPEGYADLILSVHVVEHFDRWMVEDILRDWVRVLKPGGIMICECPNLISACKQVLSNPDVATKTGQDAATSMWVLYGDPAWRDPLMCHKWAYTPQSLKSAMKEAGLVNLRQEPAQYKHREPRDMRIVGEKPSE